MLYCFQVSATRLCWRHTLEKLVPDKLVQVVLYQKLVRVSVNLVQIFSGRSFLHTVEHSCIPGVDRNCPAHDTNRATWLARELFWCKKLWWTCVRFFLQVSTSFWYKFLECVSPALHWISSKSNNENAREKMQKNYKATKQVACEQLNKS